MQRKPMYKRFWPALLLLAAGCTRSTDPASPPAAQPATLSFQPERILSDGSSQSATAMTAASAAGERAYVWSVSPPGEGTLFFQREGSSPRALPDPQGSSGLDPETPPKIAFGPKGELYLAYSVTEPPSPSGKSGTPEHELGSALRVTRSEDGGKTWSTAVGIADDGPWGAYRNDHAFHVSADGRLYAAWLDGRVPGSVRLYVSHSTDKGATWSKNVAVDAVSPCECCRIALASSASDHVYMAWRKILPGGKRDIVVASSADGGANWNAPVLTHADDWMIDGCPDAGPSLLAEPDGKLHLVWWTGKKGAAGVKYASSADGGRTWGAPVPLKVGSASRSSHAQLARGADGTLFAVWDDGLSQDPQILLAVSRDGGQHFEAPVTISAPGASAVFPSLAVTREYLTIVWRQSDPIHKELQQVVARTAKLL